MNGSKQHDAAGEPRQDSPHQDAQEHGDAVNANAGAGAAQGHEHEHDHHDGGEAHAPSHGDEAHAPGHEAGEHHTP